MHHLSHKPVTQMGRKMILDALSTTLDGVSVCAAGATDVGTVYVQGSDCTSNNEGCVLGIASKISGATGGNFFQHDATCFGRYVKQRMCTLLTITENVLLMHCSYYQHEIVTLVCL